MPDIFGAVELPVPSPAPGETVGDPALDSIAAYLSAVLPNECGAAWLTVAPSEPLLSFTYKWDPVRFGLYSTDFLPALYLWRESVQSTRIADDFNQDSGQIILLWILPPADADAQARRAPFINALTKAVSKVIWKGRNKLWVDPNDSDGTAATRGSVLLSICRFSKMRYGGANAATVSVKDIEGIGGDQYQAIRMVLHYVEFFDAGTEDFSVADGESAVVQAEDPGGFSVPLKLYPPVLDSEGNPLLDKDGDPLDLV